CDEAARELRKLGHVPRVVPTRGLAAGPIPALSSRELQVVERLGAGMTNRQIAEELFLSVRTVDRHTARIYEKLGVNSRAAAASRAARSLWRRWGWEREGPASASVDTDTVLSVRRWSRRAWLRLVMQILGASVRASVPLPHQTKS